LTRFLK